MKPDVSLTIKPALIINVLSVNRFTGKVKLRMQSGEKSVSENVVKQGDRITVDLSYNDKN